jgi:hypothetical protein
MEKDEKITSLVQAVVGHVAKITTNFKKIKPLRDMLENAEERGLAGHGAFGDKVGNNLVPLHIFGNDALASQNETEKSQFIQDIIDCYNSSSDKPAYKDESRFNAMKRTLSALETAMRAELSEQFPAESFATIKQSLLDLDKDIKTLKSLVPDAQAYQR